MTHWTFNHKKNKKILVPNFIKFINFEYRGHTVNVEKPHS